MQLVFCTGLVRNIKLRPRYMDGRVISWNAALTARVIDIRTLVNKFSHVA